MWLPSYATPSERFLRILLVLFALTVMLFLIAPLIQRLMHGCVVVTTCDASDIETPVV